MKKNVIRLLFALVALMTSTSMLAENKLWIDGFTVPANKSAEVTIQMENQPSLAALQFTLILPKGLVFESSQEVEDGNWLYIRRNPERFSNSQQLMSTLIAADTLKCAVFALRDETFKGTKGPLAYFNVKSNVVETFEGQVKIEDIIMTTFGGEKLPCEDKYEVDVTINSQIGVASTAESLVMYPGSSFQLPITLYNPQRWVQGLQMDVKLPKGFTMGDTFEHTSRVTTTSMVNATYNESENSYRLILVDPTGKNAVENKDDVYSTIFYCDLNVPETIEPDSKIVISNVIGSGPSNEGHWDYETGQYVYDQLTLYGMGAEISVVDGGPAYTNAMTVIDALQTAKDDALETIATECPDVKDDFTGEDIQTAIDNLKAAVDAAYADYTLMDNYDEVMAPAETIQADIEMLIANAKAAQTKFEEDAAAEAAKAEQERKDKNKAAYDAVLAELNKLYASYRATVAEIQANYKPYEDVSAELALRNALDSEKDAIDEAYKAVENEGEFEYDFDAEAFQTQIDKLLEDAKALAEKTENDRVAANQAAYDADKDEILALEAELDAAVEKILAEYPEYKDVTVDSRNIDKAIAEVKEGAKEAFDACKEEGSYSYDWDPQAIRDMIADMLAKAEADGVEAIIADVEAGNAVVFTLDGKQHARPVNGEVNIIVRRNGEKSKVFVK